MNAPLTASQGQQASEEKVANSMLLYQASERGDTVGVLTALEAGANINFINKQQRGRNPLYIAAMRGHTEVMKILLERGANINQTNESGFTPINSALLEGGVEAVRLLIGAGADISIPEEDGWTPLNNAADTGFLDIVQILIKSGADINTPSNNGWTPLNSAANKGFLDIVQILIKSDADINTPNNNGWTPLNSAANKGFLDIVQILIKSGADINTPNNNSNTPVNRAAASGFIDIVRVLIEEGADVNKPSKWGKKPMGNAANPDIKALLKNAESIRKQKETSLLLYEASKRGDTVGVLRAMGAGANINFINMLEFGRNPLYIAAMEGHVEVIKVLLTNGANINQLNENGESALFIATKNDKHEVISLLLANKAEVMSNIIISPQHKIKSVIDNEEIIDEIIQTKTKQWGRAKWMIIGPGTAGKTAFSRSIIGSEFEDTASTVGLEKPGVFDVCQLEDNSSIYKLEKIDSSDSLLHSSVASLLNFSKSSADSQQQNADNPVQSSVQSEESINLEELYDKVNKPKQLLLIPKLSQKSMISTVFNSLFKSENKSSSSASSTPTTQSDKNSSSKTEKKKMDSTPLEFDKIMKSLGTINTNSNKKSSGVILTIYDFAGQSVFDVIHHMFLTSYGVYTLVFNMELLVVLESETSFKLRLLSDPQLKWCIGYLKYWMNAIYSHCKLMKSNDSDVIERPPPVLLIGTRKDIVSDQHTHKEISDLLYELLHDTAAWKHALQLNEDDRINFFPVDNTKSINDDTIRRVVMCVNNIISNRPYVKKQIPLSWLQLVDYMNKIKDNEKSFISMDELLSISMNYGINKEVLCEILEFLNEMSYFLWNNDSSLRDVIILDPIDYFIKPVTNIISNHTDKSGANRIQHSDLQERAKLKFPSDWNRFVSEGIASFELISFLLEEYSDRLSAIMILMTKFGLMVHLDSRYDVMIGTTDTDIDNNAKDNNNNNCKLYLFPSIVPIASAETRLSMIQPWTTRPIHIIHFIFTARELALSVPIIPLNSLHDIGFCPVGFFHRLIGKVLTWCQEIQYVSGPSSRRIIYGDMIKLTFIDQQFLMHLIPDHNCLEVMIEGENPLAIHRRLKNQINEVLRECFANLHVVDAVAYPYKSYFSLKSDSEIDFIPLSGVITAIEKHTRILTEPDPIRPEVLKQTYHSWIPPSISTPYDVFLSYRWSDYDTKLTKKMFDILSSFNQPNSNSALHVFRDVEILLEGSNLKEGFSSALSNSRLFVPIISYNALQGLVNHDVNQVDNMLIEWLIAVELSSPHHRSNANNNIRIRGIYPIFIHNDVDVTCSEWPIGKEVEENVISLLVRHAGGPVKASFSAGDKIEANYHNKGKWFSGVIKTDRGNRVYDIQYDGYDLLTKKGGVLSNLPKIIPTETIEKAAQLLRDQGIEPRPSFFTMTVKGVLDAIQEFLYHPRWDFDRRERMICQKILDVLR